MEVLSEHLCQGWLEGYTLTGRHGVFATYEAFAMVSASMAVQHVKWLQHAQELPWRASVPSLNVLLTSTCWRNDHNGFSHQGPGLIDSMLPLSPGVVRVWLPPDANTTLSIMDHCLRSTDHVNLIVVDKQPHLQYLTLDEAHRHNAAGAGIWEWASSCPDGERPDIVLACAGDVPTQEALAAAELLRDHVPDLKVRFVNVVDLMALLPENDHPHGFADSQFDALFTADRDVVFAFHGYPRAVHQVIHGRSEPGAVPRPRLQRAGHDDHAVRHGRAQPDVAASTWPRRCCAGPRAGWTAGTACSGSARSGSPSTRRTSVEHLEDMPDIAGWTWRG